VIDSQTHVIKNCLSFTGLVSITSGIQEKNSWQGFTVTGSDFVSTDTGGITVRRNADGRLPESAFMRLAPTSSLIDAGVSVGLPFGGKAPDLGAFETGTVTGIGESGLAPLEFNLGQNFPNPFNPTTTISFQLSVVSYVKLAVYDALGREIAVLVQEEQQPGIHLVHWNASSVASGVYFSRLDARPVGGNAIAFVQIRKMVLVK
jgi:hypothetical protein